MFAFVPPGLRFSCPCSHPPTLPNSVSLPASKLPSARLRVPQASQPFVSLGSQKVGRRGSRRRPRGRGAGGTWGLEPGQEGRKEGGEDRSGAEGGRASAAQEGAQAIAARPLPPPPPPRPLGAGPGRDGLARGLPLLLPRPAAHPPRRAPPAGEWPRGAGREDGGLTSRPDGQCRGRSPGGAGPQKGRMGAGSQAATQS